jgi:hydrogenase small subunit
MKGEEPSESAITEFLQRKRISRRDFFKGCGFLALALGLSQADGIAQVALALATKPRPPVIWLELQDCTGCTESMTRSQSPQLVNLILSDLSLDYHETLQAASGAGAEESRQATMRNFAGRYILVVEGSPTAKDGGVYCVLGGRSNIEVLKETAASAAAVIAVGNCACFGGIPAARPSPSGGVGVASILGDAVVNIPGCPPIAEAMTTTFAHLLVFDRLPALDPLGRPLEIYRNTIHDRCVRRTFYDSGRYAKGFDDPGAKEGYCLYLLGCKGPTTYNACPTLRWNGGISYPVQAGHPCLGCSEPGFWDGPGFYAGQSVPLDTPSGLIAAAALAGGAALGIGAALVARSQGKNAEPPIKEAKHG